MSTNNCSQFRGIRHDCNRHQRHPSSHHHVTTRVHASNRRDFLHLHTPIPIRACVICNSEEPALSSRLHQRRPTPLPASHRTAAACNSTGGWHSWRNTRSRWSGHRCQHKGALKTRSNLWCRCRYVQTRAVVRDTTAAASTDGASTWATF